MPRRGGGSGAASRAPLSREVMISKKVSYVLRHGAEKEGLKLDRNGYANCADLLQWRNLRSLNVSFPELQSIVASNDKQRFQLVPLTHTDSSASFTSHETASSSEPAHYLIRASQGHSLPIASEALLTPILLPDNDFPEEVVHGTFPAAWKLILKSGGLSRMRRQHVHFAKGLPSPPNAKQTAPVLAVQEREPDSLGKSDELVPVEDENGSEPAVLALDEGKAGEQKVISGMRRDASVLIWVDVRRSISDGGLKWWRSANGVILTEGDSQGMVSIDFVKRVEKRGGSVMWEPAGETSADKLCN
ncbi:hypothetical protein MMC11_004380 [Xylographa trunciseda]|nr:hypothetical protein [Xylographa trunciseda]